MYTFGVVTGTVETLTRRRGLNLSFMTIYLIMLFGVLLMKA